jgi:hypothetical protein
MQVAACQSLNLGVAQYDSFKHVRTIQSQSVHMA